MKKKLEYTVMMSFIVNDFLGIGILCFLIYWVSVNTLLPRQLTLRYLRVVILTLTIIVFELLSIVFLNATPQLKWLSIICSTINFILTPLVFIWLALLTKPFCKRNLWLYLPLIAYAALMIVSMWTGWVFTISADNRFVGGSLIFISYIISGYGLCVFLFFNLPIYEKYDTDEKVFLFFLVLLIFVSVFIQALVKDVLMIWMCVSIVLTLYFSLLKSRQYKHDGLTQMYNRRAFNTYLSTHKTGENASIIMFDLNGLKCVNDKYGHLKGDEVIVKACADISTCFSSFSNLYRIGGDEFCAVCHKATEEQIQQALDKLKAIAVESIEQEPLSLSIACGYKMGCPEQSIEQLFEQADLLMYSNKKTSRKN
ncbi:MAG: GGDEF domain-containing protein [Clostridia bacterium]